MGARLESCILVCIFLDPRLLTDSPASRAPDEHVPTLIVFWATHSPLVLMVASISSFRYGYKFNYLSMTKDMIVPALWHSVMRNSIAPSSGSFFQLQSFAPPAFLLSPCGPGPSGWCTSDIKVKNGWPTYSPPGMSNCGTAILLKRSSVQVKHYTNISPPASRPLPTLRHGS